MLKILGTTVKNVATLAAKVPCTSTKFSIQCIFLGEIISLHTLLPSTGTEVLPCEAYSTTEHQQNDDQDNTKTCLPHELHTDYSLVKLRCL
jgi:hypothetical protein